MHNCRSSVLSAGPSSPQAAPWQVGSPSHALALAGLALLTLVPSPVLGGKETSGLFVEFTATRNQEEPPATLRTKQMCPDRPGTHTFAPDLRVENGDEAVITNTFIGFTFDMILTRRGIQETFEKTARFRVTPRGTRPIEGGAARINFNLLPGDCVDLGFAPVTDLFLLSGEVLTASLFLTREPAGTPPPPPPPPPPGATMFSQFQAQIFTPTCAAGGCHAAASAQAGLVLEAGQSYDNLVGVPSTQQPALSRVSPGNPEESYLIKKLRGDADIVGDRMPRGGPFLDQADIDALIAWISAGAPEN